MLVFRVLHALLLLLLISSNRCGATKPSEELEARKKLGEEGGHNDNTIRSLATQSCPSGWKQASGTVYDSWPKPGSTECIDYEGCKWAGQFSNVDSGYKKCCCKNGAQWLDGGDGDYDCRFDASLVKELRPSATYDKDNALLNKKLEVRVAGSDRSVVTNVIDECSDSDCDYCCKHNTNNKKFKLIDLEAQVACELLQLDYNDPDFDVNNLDLPTNKRKGAASYTMPLCYKVLGDADNF